MLEMTVVGFVSPENPGSNFIPKVYYDVDYSLRLTSIPLSFDCFSLLSNFHFPNPYLKIVCNRDTVY